MKFDDNIEYEVYSLYPTRKQTDAHSCEQNCLKCHKVCDIGLLNYEIHNKEVGA